MTCGSPRQTFCFPSQHPASPSQPFFPVPLNQNNSFLHQCFSPPHHGPHQVSPCNPANPRNCPTTNSSMHLQALPEPPMRISRYNLAYGFPRIENNQPFFHQVPQLISIIHLQCGGADKTSWPRSSMSRSTRGGKEGLANLPRESKTSSIN